MPAKKKKEAFISREDALGQGDSVVNQKIKSQFVSKHVYCNVTSMTEYILKRSWEDRDAPFSWDDVENRMNDSVDDAQDWGESNLDKKELKVFNKLDGEDKIEYAKNNGWEPEYREVYEWWMVDGWLCEMLQQNGECVIDSEAIWGRCTTGQAILLDYVITKICADLEILEGQRNSWAVK